MNRRKHSIKASYVACLIAVCAAATGVSAQAPTPTPTPVPVPAQPPADIKDKQSLASQPVVAPPVQGALPDALKIDKTKHDWGEISDTGAVEHTFTVTNISTETIKLAVAASCGCTVPSLPKNTLAPGESAPVTAKFDPKGRSGLQAKTLTITVVEPSLKYNQQRMELTSMVKALVLVNPPKVFLSEVDYRQGQTSKVIVTGRKEGFQVLKAESPSEFVKTTIGAPVLKDVNGEKLTEVEVTFDIGKGAPLGSLQSAVTLTTNDERAPTASTFVGAEVIGDVRANPANAILRVLSAGAPFSSEIRLDSRTGTSFDITSIEIEEPMKTLQVVADVVRSDDGKYHTITFAGVATQQTGMIQGAIIVSTNAEGGQTLRIPFSGSVRKAQAQAGSKPGPMGSPTPPPAGTTSAQNPALTPTPFAPATGTPTKPQ